MPKLTDSDKPSVCVLCQSISARQNTDLIPIVSILQSIFPVRKIPLAKQTLGHGNYFRQFSRETEATAFLRKHYQDLFHLPLEFTGSLQRILSVVLAFMSGLEAASLSVVSAIYMTCRHANRFGYFPCNVDGTSNVTSPQPHI